MHKSVRSIWKLYKSAKINYLFNYTFMFIADFILNFCNFWSVYNTLDIVSCRFNTAFAFAGNFYFSLFFVYIDSHFKLLNYFTDSFACLTDNLSDKAWVYMKKVRAWQDAVIKLNIFLSFNHNIYNVSSALFRLIECLF